MPAERRTPVSLAQLAWIMLYIGIAGYGGGPAIIAFAKQLIVDRHGWMREDEYLTGVSLSQLLPGANALSTVTYIGFQLGGSLGAIIAPVCFIIPSLVLMTALSALYFAYGSLPITRALFTGLGAIVVGLLVNALIVMGRSAIKSYWAALIAVTAFLSMLLLHAPILLVIAGVALLGLLIFRRGPVESAPVSYEPPPGSRSFWWWWVIVLVGAAMLAMLTVHTTATEMILAFLRVGALTFGGGYSAVPLFHSEAVVTHHWLTDKQFLDGLALGQITPGPVLITATFIGYHVMGVTGAILGTFAVFLPGGLLMYIVAHQHSRIMQYRWLQAMVQGIIAGFIGVLLSITVQLARQSVFDWKTAMLAVVSALVLVVAKQNALWVILGGAVLSIFLFR